MTKYTFCENTISDLHKDAWGCRPTERFWFHWEIADQDAKQAIWDNLIDDMVKNDAEEARIKAENVSNLAKRIKDTCKLGANNYKTAIKWILEADGLEHDKYYGGDQLAWEFNIGFKHNKLFKLAGVA
tara:strand:- start:10517 stop:10900 length:384 start_codon:yes stop_codon:yes gene_type:complete